MEAQEKKTKPNPPIEISNKDNFLLKVKEELGKTQLLEKNIAIAYFDVDNFGKINKEYGTAFGDKILNRIAAFFQLHMTRVDFLARLENDEFAIMIPRVNLSDIINLMDELRKGLLSEFGDGTPKVTLSVGFAIFKKDTEGFATVHNLVLSLLFAAKTRGKNAMQTSIYER